MTKLYSVARSYIFPGYLVVYYNLKFLIWYQLQLASLTVVSEEGTFRFHIPIENRTLSTTL